jgi:hypothetical protein
LIGVQPYLQATSEQMVSLLSCSVKQVGIGNQVVYAVVVQCVLIYVQCNSRLAKRQYARLTVCRILLLGNGLEVLAQPGNAFVVMYCMHWHVQACIVHPALLVVMVMLPWKSVLL